MFTIDEFDPFAPVTPVGLQVYDGGTYTAGINVVYPGSPVRTLDGSTYANGTQIPPFAYSLNGGTY